MPAERVCQQVPAHALRMAIGACTFAQSQAAGEGHRFSMLARSAEPVNHWWWGIIYHDFAGMRHKDRIAVDFCHDPAQTLGYADDFAVGNVGLTLRGALLDTLDQVRELIAKADFGIPFEASIQFDDDTLLEWIPEKYTSTVNGRKVEGPCLIAREWNLRGVAICPYGYDANTETSFAAAGGAQSTVSLFSQDGDMPTLGKKKAAKPAAETAQKLSQETDPPADGQDGQQPQDAAAGDGADETGADAAAEEDPTAGDGEAAGTETETELSASDPRAQVRRYVQAFGAENGAKWFAEGVPFADAQTKHIAALTAQLGERDKTIGELNAKLSQVQLGEAAPVSGGSKAPPADPAAEKFAHLGDNIGRAAAGMKLPGRK